MTESIKPGYPSPDDWKALNQIVLRANKGDTQALSRLRTFLDDNPQVWQHLGDLARVAERAWIGLLSNGDQLAAGAIERQLAALKEELLEDSCSVVEKMLVDTILGTWLEVNYLRHLDADPRSRTLGQASLLIKRLESAQRRHLASLKSFLQIKRLLPGKIPVLSILRETA